MSKSINSLFTLLTLIIFTACSSVQVTEEAVGDQSVAGVSITSKSTATQAVLANAVVYFEYDQYNLTAKSIQALKGVSELMNRNSKITISIEGHADERGTREYNLALGDLRANSAALYLEDLGIDKARVNTVSLGSLEATIGLSKSAAKKDRKAELIILK